MQNVAEPASIQLNTGSVIIQWKDRHRSVYPPRFLRLRCPCAECVDEWTGVPRLDPQKVIAEVEAADFLNVGSYAVQFLWSDAHHTGIYTFKFLRDICPCDLCILEAGQEAGQR